MPVTRLLPRSDGRIRFFIVGGFLGAGKTTWLRHQLFNRRFGAVHVLVNEAAGISVDHELLGSAHGIDVLAGGCACCEGREALRQTLRNLCDREVGNSPAGLKTIVLETSGLAEPLAIAEMIDADPILGRRIAIESTIVLVDAAFGAAQLVEEPLARAQVEAADEIVVTKVDAAPDNVSRLIATIHLLAPCCRLSCSRYGVEIEIGMDLSASPYELGAGAEKLEPIRPYQLPVSADRWPEVSTWLSALLFARGDRIIRTKGIINTPAGRILLQAVHGHMQSAEVLTDESADTEHGFIVLIGRGIVEERLRKSWRRLLEVQ